jgi:hypothetical protein
MRAITFLSCIFVIGLSACASAPRGQTATSGVQPCGVASVVTLPEQDVRAPRAPYRFEGAVVTAGADSARGQRAAGATAPRVVAQRDASITRGNAAPASCTYDHASAKQSGAPRS